MISTRLAWLPGKSVVRGAGAPHLAWLRKLRSRWCWRSSWATVTVSLSACRPCHQRGPRWRAVVALVVLVIAGSRRQPGAHGVRLTPTAGRVWGSGPGEPGWLGLDEVEQEDH